MSEAPGAPSVREMGYSVDEFQQVLPRAMRDWQVRGAAPAWQVHDAAGRVIADVYIEPMADRQIGMLCLPVLAVRVVFGDRSGSLVAEFWRRFERGFHRGGG